MNIRMYDCGFGDCFQINEGSTEGKASHLLVDCGWQKDSIVFSEIKKAYINSAQPLSFLLTHYHEDHFRGFCEMIKCMPKRDWISFDHIYIPDIWNAATDVELVALLLMSELKKGKLFLIDFLMDLLKTNGECHFVKAGDVIDGRYLVLWPQKSFISNKAKEDFNSVWKGKIESPESTAMRTLASDLIHTIAGWKGSNENTELQLIQLNELERIKKIQKSYVGEEKMLGIKGVRIGLAAYGNNASIVFQSKDSTPKLLFTGDFPKKFWTEIESKLLKKYDVIKVPHHGTEYYYWENISEYFADTAMVLIPNGNPGGQKWYIHYKYPKHLKDSENQYKIYCFNMNACPVALGNGEKCVCSPNGGCIPELNPKNVYFDFVL